jgi:hypothetical protein
LLGGRRVQRNFQDEVEEMNEEYYKTLDIIMAKELILNEIIVWLKAKGLWEECKKDISIKISSEKAKAKD